MINSKIKDLAWQAGVYPLGKVSILDVELFAKLIVEECARVQHERFCDHGDVSWDVLMDHFGIKP